jgi:hypothetical protein|tara:strand:- start:678 stop:851 length:174 start_codon:yes stop_codon:yes gene_type:complete
MATKNDITGDELKSKNNTKAYEDNYDRIFGKKKKEKTFNDIANEHPAQDQFNDQKNK